MNRRDVLIVIASVLTGLLLGQWLKPILEALVP